MSCRGYQAPVVKRRSCRPTKPAVEVRVLPGARVRERQARLAHQQSAPSTPERQEGQHLHWVLRCLDPDSEGPGREPGMSGGGTRQAPQGRADHVARTPGCKPVASAVQVRLLPRPPPRRHLPPWQRNCRRASEARLSQFDSGQGDAARSTRDVRLPPKQTGASSSLAEPAQVFRCGSRGGAVLNRLAPWGGKGERSQPGSRTAAAVRFPV